MRFRDRRHAGEILGSEVAGLDPPNPVVYALPRGGLPVAFEVARALGCLLDVLMVRKVGVPVQPELAMGAVAEDGVVVRNDEVINMVRISDWDFDAAADRARGELADRTARYRAEGEKISPRGHAAVIVDDGLATGSTAKAAIEVLREQGASAVWLAVPVAPRETLRDLEREADRVVVLASPRRFGSVGSWYRDFTQTSDEEVRGLLAEARR